LQGSEVIVVDDGSTDGSVNFITQNYPQIKLISKPFNDGFSTAVNLGIKAASNELVLLINTDVVPTKDFLKYLLPHFENPKIFAVGCLDKSIEGDQVTLRGRGTGKFFKGFLQHQRGEIDQKDTLWVNGGSGIFRKAIWELLGGMDELYNPFYWEDIDLSYRALKSGYLILFEPKSQVIHKHEQGSIKRRYSPKKITQIAYRNQIIFVWKNITSLAYLIQHLIYLPYYLVLSLIKGDNNFIKGFTSAFILLPEVFKKRKISKSKYIMTDEQIFQKYQ